MEEKSELEMARDEWFNNRIIKLESSRVINQNYSHVLKVLYSYKKQIENQLDEELKTIKENEEEPYYLVELQMKIETELNKFKLLPSASKIKRKVSRQNKKID